MFKKGYSRGMNTVGGTPRSFSAGNGEMQRSIAFEMVER